MSRTSAVTSADDRPLLRVEDLVKHYPLGRDLFAKSGTVVRAVDGVSLTVRRGETLGLVGESGCGKSTLGRAILRLVEPTGGKVYFDNEDVLGADHNGMRALRRRMQVIFQDPYASLNPRMTVSAIVEEFLRIHRIGTAKSRRERVVSILERVGLRSADLGRYPHEFSGGQRQRIGIARVLAISPDLIIGDEPVSALDVSIQAQVINLLEDLQAEFEITYLIVSHNLAVIEHMSDQIAVMYLGKIVEIGPTSEIQAGPLHPYTEALMSAVPSTDPDTPKTRILLPGDPPSPIRPPEGCRFHPRCAHARNICREVEPQSREIRPRHFAACHFPLGNDHLRTSTRPANGDTFLEIG